MINALINGSLNFLIGVLNFILLPIDTLIDNYLPAVDVAFTYASDFLAFIGGFIPWIMSWISMPLWFLQLVFGYMVFRLMVFLGVSTLKTVLAWFQALKFW